jgi:hypothetical protein
MSDALPLEITKPAVRQIREAELWWRENRLAAQNMLSAELQRDGRGTTKH